MTLRLLRRMAVCCVLGLASLSLVARADDTKPIKIGFIGMDNYQVVEFTHFFHNPDGQAHAFKDKKALDVYRGFQIVAAWKGGSDAIPAKWRKDMDERWMKQIVLAPVKSKTGEIIKSYPVIEVFEDPQEVIKRSDVIMVMSVDANQHLEQARWAIKAKKPLFIGRPMTASLLDAVRIVQEAEAAGVPVFSCSQHRFSPGFIGMRNHPEVGKVMGADIYGGCEREPHHPDLTWQGIHGVETLYTMMGPGCVSVTRAATDKADVVTGTWSDGRVGVYRGIRDGAIKWSGVVFGDKGVSVAGIYGHGVPSNGVVPHNDAYMSYLAVAAEIAKFFKTGKPPITNAELLEVYTFLEAAEESKRQNGAPVTLASVLAKAKAEVAAKPKK